MELRPSAKSANISTTCRPTSWKGKPKTFKKINKTINSWKSDKIRWFVDTFKYDGLKDSNSSTSETQKKDTRFADAKGRPQAAGQAVNVVEGQASAQAHKIPLFSGKCIALLAHWP